MNHINNSPKREKSLWQKIKDGIKETHQKNIKWIFIIWFLLASIFIAAEFHDGFSIAKLFSLLFSLIFVYLSIFIVFIALDDRKNWKKITKENRKIRQMAKVNNSRKYHQVMVIENLFNVSFLLSVLFLIIQSYKLGIFGVINDNWSWNKFWNWLMILAILSTLLFLFFSYHTLQLFYIRKLAEKKEDGGNN